jgi:hypothetical protein
MRGTSGGMTTHRIIADRIEAGRFRLAPPRRVEGTGGIIYQMALAVPGVHGYPFGQVLTPPEVLSDEEWLAQFAGVPIIDDDRTAHVEGVTPDDIGEQSIGRILKAWWDPEQQVVIADGVVDVQRGLDKIDRGVTGVSVGYPADLRNESGTAYGSEYTIRQHKRLPASNVAITLSPRHLVTHLQADSTGAEMNPTVLAALMALFPTQTEAEVKKQADSAGDPSMLMELIKMLLGAEQRATMAESKLAAYDGGDMAGKVKAAAEGEMGDGEMAEAEEEAAGAPEVGAFADAIRAADAAGVEVKPEWTLPELQRAVLVKRGVRSADSMSGDALSAVVTALSSVKLADAYDVIRAGASRAGNVVSDHTF